MASFPASEESLEQELRAMSRLQALSAELVQQGDLKPLLQAILSAAADLTGTAKGNIQIFDRVSGRLRILVHQGLSRRLTDHFAEDGWVATCGRAATRIERVLVEDVQQVTVEGANENLGREIVLEDGIRSIQSTPLISRDGRLLGMLNNHYLEPGRPDERKLRYIDVLARQAADFVERHQAEEALRDNARRLEEREALLAGQRESLELALRDAPLATALASLVKTAREQYGGGARAGFYLANPSATELYHVTGMSEEYAAAVDGFAIGPDSLACGLATHTGRPILTADVREEPLWKPWLAMAEQFDYRACWSFPIRSRGGNFVGTMAVYWRQPRAATPRDIELAELLTQTAALVISRHIEMDLRRQAERALHEEARRKDEFLATLAHELRNPLAPIRNALAIIEAAGDDTETATSARGMMSRQLGQMVRLIDDLLDVSRISRGLLELRKERVALASIVEQAVETCRPAADAFGHELSVAAPEPAFVDADPVRLVQALSNVLYNACKFTPPGGRIALSATVVRGDGAKPEEIVVSVRDNGVGIPPEKLTSVFELFSQVDRSMERTHGGLGIGLTLSKRLVEMHGGTIEARSEGAGRGSEFIVRLLAAASEAPQVAGRRIEPLAEGKRRVLVVDDNRDNAESLAMLLRMKGHGVETAFDGEQAVAAAASHRPEVILLDIGLPKLNGYDACRRIRSEPWGRDAMIVALTGWGQEEDRRRSGEAGFDGHLVKPVDHLELMNLMASRTKKASAP